jgi:glycosyltransferase involved in cell wall biosynthesis
LNDETQTLRSAGGPGATGRPTVSVVIATRDRWPLLAANALPGALGQDGVAIEVLVVDDGSADETPLRLGALDDPRLRVVRNDTSLGLPAARNAGIAAARGEWLAFLDDDDHWAPTKLHAQLAAAARDGAAWAYGRAVVVDAAGQALEADPFPEPRALPGLLQQGNWIPGGGSNVVVRADLVRRLGGFDEELRFFEDWDLWLRLLQHGLPAACDDIVMARTEHRGNMAVRDRAEVLPALERLLGKHRRVTRDDRLSVAQWLAHEQYRRGSRLRAAWHYLRAALAYRSPGNLPPAVGVLFGDRGLRAASRLLEVLTGSSHLLVTRAAPPDVPSWLAERRRAPTAKLPGAP